MEDNTIRIENSNMLRVGSTLQMGKYRIDRYLSSGGFGNTYAATNTEFDEQVAIKEFFMKGISERESDTVSVSVSNLASRPVFEEQLEKFKKEARRLRKMNCRHIVKVHDLFEENGTAYYVMDFIDGESLKEMMMRTKEPMTEEQVRGILPQILDALEEVHDMGIWHLDLKPANIMIDKKGNTSLVDFGASKQMKLDGSGATTSTTPSYTAGYAPSEQMEGRMELVGNWTDLYGLGATLYKLLTDNKPPMLSDILMMKDNAFHYPDGVSQQMRQLIRWMMQVDRSERPQSVAEVRAFLEAKQPEEEATTPVTPPAADDDAEKTKPIVAPAAPPKADVPKTPPTPKTPSTPAPSPKTPEQPKVPVAPQSSEPPKSSEQPKADIPHTPSSLVGRQEQPKRKGILYVVIALIVLLLGGGTAWYFLSGDKGLKKDRTEEREDHDDEDRGDGDDEAEIVDVTDENTFVILPGGEGGDDERVEYVYTGPMVDGKAHGKGHGEYDMGSYDGRFRHGFRHGQGKFVFKESGDVFEGTFKEDYFHKGTYRDVKNKQYFEGEFQNGNFYNGDWYNEDGSHFAKVVEGKEKRD